jgi:ribosomal protein RSM22 (predicted rRNA methylase)
MAPKGAFFLMNITYNQLQKYSLSPNLSESNLIKILKEINLSYTQNREGMEKVSWTSDWVSAYSLFYLSTNRPKLSFVLNNLSKVLVEKIKNCEVVDIGCGPGTYSLALAEFFNEELSGPFWGIDIQNKMLEQAEKYMNHFCPSLSFKTERNLSKLPVKVKERLLVFGHSLNEMGINSCLKAIEESDADYLIFIEPGTKEVFQELMELRSRLKKEWQIHYPCPSDYDCPLLERKDDWCHQVLRMTHEEEVERLSQLIKRDRKTMPLAAHVYARRDKKIEQEQRVQMVRFLQENKHSFTWEVCLPEEEEGRVVQFEIPKKHLSKKEVKSLHKGSVGNFFRYELIKKMPFDIYRVRLIS